MYVCMYVRMYANTQTEIRGVIGTDRGRPDKSLTVIIISRGISISISKRPDRAGGGRGATGAGRRFEDD